MKTRLSDLLTLPRIAALSVLAFVILLVVLTRLTAPPEFDFLAGPKDSTFYRDAMRFKDILMRDGVRLNVIETRGSLDNLRLLLEAEEPTAAFMDAVGAIELAETRVARDSGVAPEDIVSPFDQLTSLGAIYLQPIWIFVLADSVLEGVEDMNEARLGVGPEGSSSRMLAESFLQNVRGEVTVELVEIGGADEFLEVEEVTAALRTGQVQAVIAAGQPQNRIIDGVLRTPDIRAANVRRAEAYALHFPYLVTVRLPEGGYDLGEDIPGDDLLTLAASTELIVTDLFPPPLADLLLQATSEVHGEASLFTERNAFPNPDMVSINLSTSAARYYESGPPLLRKYLPFQLATWIDRFIMVVVAFGSIAIAVFSILPKLIEMHLDRQLQAAYRRMEEVEKAFVAGSDRSTLLAILDDVDTDTSDIRIRLRSSIASWLELRQFLYDLRERIAAGREA
jgi:TRAP-type uncharacterized transport system substrate-binding protein